MHLPLLQNKISIKTFPVCAWLIFKHSDKITEKIILKEEGWFGVMMSGHGHLDYFLSHLWWKVHHRERHGRKPTQLMKAVNQRKKEAEEGTVFQYWCTPGTGLQRWASFLLTNKPNMSAPSPQHRYLGSKPSICVFGGHI